jgi:hypothetical protein
MFAVALIAFAAVPLQALAQVIAGGTVGTELEPPRNSISEPELPALPDLSDLPDPTSKFNNSSNALLLS